MTDEQEEAIRALVLAALDAELPKLEGKFMEAVSDFHAKIAGSIRHEVRDEVAIQLSGFSARLSSIESQAASNGEHTMEARRETAGVAAMLTAFFGTDGSGGTLGIALKNSASDSRRANELAHKIYGHLDTLVGRGWLQKQLDDETTVRVEKKRDRRWGFVKWGGGALVTGVGGSRVWHWASVWYHRYF